MNSLAAFNQSSVQNQLGKLMQILSRILGSAGSFSMKASDFIKQLMSSDSSTAIKFAKSLKNSVGSQMISPRALFNHLLLFMKDNPAPGTTAITKFKEGAELMPVVKEMVDFFQIIFYIVYYTTIMPLSYLCALLSIAWDYKHIPEVQAFMAVLVMFILSMVAIRKKSIKGVRISPMSSSKSTPKTPSPKSSPKTPSAPEKRKIVQPAIMVPIQPLPGASGSLPLAVTSENLRLLEEALKKEAGVVDTRKKPSPTKSQSTARTVVTTMTEKERSPEQLAEFVLCKHIKKGGVRCTRKTKSTTELCYAHKMDARKKGLIPQGTYREVQRITTIYE